MVGVGLTVMVKLRVGPTQPFAVGVAVMVAVTGAVPLFRPVKAEILPVPFAARPMLVRSLVQEYVVPVTGPANKTAVVLPLLHIT